MKSNRRAILFTILVFGAGGLLLSLVYGGVEGDLDTLCAIAAIAELDPSGEDRSPLDRIVGELDTQPVGRTVRNYLGLITPTEPGSKYALFLGLAHADGYGSFQCPALQRLFNPHPRGTAEWDWQLLCDLGVELEALPGLAPLERRQRVRRRFEMEAAHAGMRAALAQPEGEVLAALQAVVAAEAGRPPTDCGLAEIWPNR